MRTEDYKSQGTLLSSGKSLEVEAKENVVLHNVDMTAQEDITLSGENVAILSTSDRHIEEESHESIEVGATVTSDSASLTAELLKESSRTTTTTVNQSEINAGGSFKVNAKNDITIVSANINANEEVSLDAGNNVTIAEAKNTTTTETSKESLKGELSVKVKNEYAEAVKSAEAVDRARKSIKDIKSKYDDYKEDLKEQKVKLANLKEDFKNGKIGIEQSDIDEFSELISDLKSDDAFYKTALVAATATLATKTTALIAQTAKAARSSGTGGFTASFELKGTANKEESTSSSQSSVASNISANKFTIKAKNKATIQGSNVSANEGEIEAKTIEVLASQDKSNSNSSSKTVEVTASIDTSGDISNTQGSVSGSTSDSSSTTYNNSNLNFNNLKLTSKEDTIIKGATVNASQNLDLDVGGSLVVESVQNTNRNSSGSMDIGSEGSMSASKSQSKEKTTVLTSLSGAKVNIYVEDNTNLKGALITSTSNDLTLDTKTLTTSNLSNTKSSRNISLGGSSGSTVSANLSLGNQNSKSKTLATITEGNINVRDKENSTDINKLNRNKEDINLDLYDVKSDVSVSAEVDTNLLTKEGRNKIKEDVMVSGMIADTITQIVTNDTVGITDFFSNTNQEVKTYDGVKEAISKDPKLVALLNNPDITDAQKEVMLDKITDSVMVKLGYKDNKPDNKIIETTTAGRDGNQVKGFYSLETKDSYINKEYVKDNEDLVKVAGTEMQRAIDANEGSKFDQSDEYREERSKYSQHRGDNVVKYTNFAMDITNQGSISNEVNTYVSPKVTSSDSVFNRSSITNQNNSVFDGLNKEKGDNFGAKDFGVRTTYSHEGLTKPRVTSITREQGRNALGNAGLKYYGTIASIGSIGATGATAGLLWTIGTVTDSISVYQTKDYTQGIGSVIGLPMHGKTGAIGAAGYNIYNNYIRD